MKEVIGIGLGGFALYQGFVSLCLMKERRALSTIFEFTFCVCLLACAYRLITTVTPEQQKYIDENNAALRQMEMFTSPDRLKSIRTTTDQP